MIFTSYWLLLKNRHAQHGRVIFWLGGLRQNSLCPLCFHLCHPKQHNVKKTKGLQKDRKKILIYLNSHRYCVTYYLYCLNTSALKWNASLPYLLLSPLQMLFGLVTQCPLFPIWESVCCVTRPHNSCKRDYAYCHYSSREKIKIIRLQLVTLKI